MSGSPVIDLCPRLPDVSADLGITLPWGGELKAMRDFTRGIPNDCSMTFNLLLQLPPLLGGIHCLLKVLDVLSSMVDFFDSDDPMQFVDRAGKVLGKLNDLSECLPNMMIPNILKMICDILKLIIKLLSCIKEFLASIASFQGSIDLTTAEDNPPVLDVLTCAKDNSNLTVAHVLAAIKPLSSILDGIAPLADMAGVTLKLPDLSAITPEEDIGNITSKLDDAIAQLSELVDTTCP